jgi:hypothetical protein
MKRNPETGRFTKPSECEVGTMTNIERRSPVQFKSSIQKSEVCDNWTVVLAYADEGQGPFLVDLSHKTRWDLQDKNLARFKPLGKEVPEIPGTCRMEDGILINRMNRTQAAIWHLLPGASDLPAESGYTDVSDATICLALFGPNALAVVEKLCALDFLDPGKHAPFLLQGPFSHVPCQLVLMERGQGFDGGLLLTCSRGYAQSMVHAVMGAGAEFGLTPAGEKRFTDWLLKPAP